MLQVMQNHLAM